MKSKMKMSGVKIALIVFLGILALIVMMLMIDYFICNGKKDSDKPCEKKWWRFWIKKTDDDTESYRRRMRRRSNYTLKPPYGGLPPIPSTGGSNEIRGPEKFTPPPMFRGVGSNMF
jgi:hypothetical protein